MERPWSTILRTLLVGVHDPQSSLRILRPQPVVVQLIWAWLQDLWRPHIQHENVPKEAGWWLDFQSFRLYRLGCDVEPFTFPKPTDLNVNMMPFVFGSKGSLPVDLHGYWDLIFACRNVCLASSDQICYLTVHESLVQAGPQRRGGVHTESPGLLQVGACEIQACWGGNAPTGGIFMLSSVPESTAVWPLIVEDHAQVVGEHGDLEHMRGMLGPARLSQPDELLWLSDRTPHESLPVAPGTYRQFFRLVIGDVTVWYEDHSTPNPLGIQPGPMTIVLSGNKFCGNLSVKRPRLE